MLKQWKLFVLSVSGLALAAALVLASTTAHASNPSEITIGFIPGENPDTLRANAVELAQSLKTKIGVNVNVLVSKDYQSLIEAMKNKKIDFAFFTAMSFVFAEKEAAAKVLLKKVWESPFYYSAIVTKKGSKLKTLKDLKGKIFAFVDEKSTSGYLHPQVYFKKNGVDPKTYFKKTIFAGNHAAAVNAVLKGEADAASVFADDPKGRKSAWEKFAPRGSDHEVLWVSDPIPNDPFCVRQDFYDDYTRLTHDVMFALVDYKDEQPEKNLMKKLFGVKEMLPATSRQYDAVRELVKELNLKPTP